VTRVRSYSTSSTGVRVTDWTHNPPANVSAHYRQMPAQGAAVDNGAHAWIEVSTDAAGNRSFSIHAHGPTALADVQMLVNLAAQDLVSGVLGPTEETNPGAPDQQLLERAMPDTDQQILDLKQALGEDEEN
jgi:hypothetical protein